MAFSMWMRLAVILPAIFRGFFLPTSYVFDNRVTNKTYLSFNVHFYILCTIYFKNEKDEWILSNFLIS